MKPKIELTKQETIKHIISMRLLIFCLGVFIVSEAVLLLLTNLNQDQSIRISSIIGMGTFGLGLMFLCVFSSNFWKTETEEFNPEV